jgi:hypothetical protein
MNRYPERRRAGFSIVTDEEKRGRPSVVLGVILLDQPER